MQRRSALGDGGMGDGDSSRTLWDALIDAGYLAADVETIGTWSDSEREEARAWCVDGTVEGLPQFLRALVDEQ